MKKIKLNNTTILIIAFAVMFLFIIVMLIFNPKNPNQPTETEVSSNPATTDFNVPANTNPPTNEVVLVDPNLLATAPGNLTTPPTSTPTIPGQDPSQTAAPPTTTGNPKMSTTPEERYMDIEQIGDYSGGDPPALSAPEQIRQQSEILGVSDFAPAGAANQLMLEDGLRSYFNLNPPPFLYRLIVVARTFNYDTQTGNGNFRLTVSNQQSNNEPDLRYNVTFTTNPPTINFAKL